ncbi:MAG: Holliday junction branch migration protein RuvA [Oscillospiraceae bacterium]|nr:Holliday junction branch migration protein RuvA [Oscillospiraceae bacterium]
MFYHLMGTVADLEPNLAVIDCGGVGFAVNVSANTAGRLNRGAQTKLYISEQIREDAFDLYGFSTAAEKRCFEMLLAVSGVGPKAALAILSVNTPEGVSMAVLTDDEKALTAAAGVGKRLAQRIILELKDKLKKQAPELVLSESGPAVPVGEEGHSKLADVTSALTVLGYSRAECTAAMRGLDLDTLSLEDAIRAALRNMMK